MNKLTDRELLEELQYRFSQNKKSLEELSALTRQLQTVNNKLKESEKIKSQFLSNIRNEMNNPLASILALSKNIQSIDPSHRERIKSMAALIHKEAFSLDFQLKNIFAAAELESGELVLEVVQTDIYAIISSVVDMYSHQLKTKQIFLRLLQNKAMSQKSIFKTDPAKLQLILSNMLANAIEYSYPQGEIVVGVTIQNDTLNLFVQDFGVGINEAEQQVIFNRFTQLDSGTTKVHRGHGLGLSVTRSMVEFLNGKIDVSSTAGEGTIFTVTIQQSSASVEHFATDGNELFFNEGELF
jgi:signal transduction histidine kinase